MISLSQSEIMRVQRVVTSCTMNREILRALPHHSLIGYAGELLDVAERQLREILDLVEPPVQAMTMTDGDAEAEPTAKTEKAIVVDMSAVDVVPEGFQISFDGAEDIPVKIRFP